MYVIHVCVCELFPVLPVYRVCVYTCDALRMLLNPVNPVHPVKQLHESNQGNPPQLHVHVVAAASIKTLRESYQKPSSVTRSIVIECFEQTCSKWSPDAVAALFVFCYIDL